MSSDDLWSELKYEDVKKAIERGEKKAKTKLAWLMLSGLRGAEKDEDGAVALLAERVKDGDTDAMWILGECYVFGLGTEQDLVRAKKLYKQSHDGGNKIGSFFASHKENGRGDGYLRIGGL